MTYNVFGGTLNLAQPNLSNQPLVPNRQTHRDNAVSRHQAICFQCWRCRLKIGNCCNVYFIDICWLVQAMLCTVNIKLNINV